MTVKPNEAKAIETYYKNTRFRSRLEAKWALFFDELGIIWDYECEGFESRGIRYLPDFYLPELEYFFECKPYSPSNDEWRKSAVGAESSGKTVLVSWGYPLIETDRDEYHFVMMQASIFYQSGLTSMTRDIIRWPGTSDRFGIVGICQKAAKTILGDSEVVSLSNEHFRVGGFETAIIKRCPSCKKCYFDTRFNPTPRFSLYLCPFGCNLDDGFDVVASAATKARNHRFGRIA